MAFNLNRALTISIAWLGFASCCFGQDGASFDVRAKQANIPPLSLAGAPDTPDRMITLSELLQGKTEHGITDLKALANMSRRAGSPLVIPSGAEIPVRFMQRLMVFFTSSSELAGNGNRTNNEWF